METAPFSAPCQSNVVSTSQPCVLFFFPFPWTVTLAVFAVIQLGHHISDPQPVRDVLVFFTASWFEACATNVDFRVQPVP